MIPFRKSLAFRLFLLSFILLALPLLVDSFVIVQSSYEDAIRDAKGSLMAAATNRELPLTEMQPAKRPSMTFIESFLDLRTQFPKSIDEKYTPLLQNIVKEGNFETAYLIRKTEDNRFIVVASSNQNYLGRDYTDFIALMDIYSPETYRAGFFGFLAYDSKTYQPYFLVGRVVYDLENNPLGLIFVSANISEKMQDLIKTEKDPFKLNFALLLPNTIIFAASDPSLQFEYFIPLDEAYRKIFEEEELFGSKKLAKHPLEKNSLGYPFFEFEWKGKRYIGYLKHLSTSSISLLAYASKEEVFARPFINFLTVYSVYLLILLVGGLVALILTKRLAKPLFNLGEVMLKIKAGDLSARYKPDSLGYEINNLGNVFNDMIDSLLQKQTLAEKERIAKETYAQELKIGQQVQRELIVERMPEYSGVDLAARYLPAREVAGDFHDVFVEKKGNSDVLGLTIADASGKGVRACFYSLGVRSILHTYAKYFDNVSEVLKRTNDLFCLDAGDTGMFVTVFTAFYHRDTKRFSYSSCGHNPSLLRKKNGDVIILNHIAMAIGVRPHIKVDLHEVTLESGDTILFYTDGITEAHDMHFKMFTEERLIRFFKEEGAQSAGEIADKLLEEVKVFAGEAPQHDDITLLVMKVT